MMTVVFDQQCEVKPDKIEVRKAPGGNIVVNPSDPDATLAVPGKCSQQKVSGEVFSETDFPFEER